MAQNIRLDSGLRMRLIVFDLDGTLIDSVADLCAAVNAMLRHYGKQPLPEPVIASYIGDGVSMLVQRALGGIAEASVVEPAVGYFLSYYRDHKLDQTQVYPGVFEALDELRQSRNGDSPALAVLTNKPIGPSRAICDALGLSPYFFRIYGGNSFAVKKPDPEGLHALMREANASPEETVMVGDTPVDILTARSAGAWSIACSYGMAPDFLEKARPDQIVATASEWPSAVSALTR